MKNSLRNRDIILAGIVGLILWIIKIGFSIGLILLCIFFANGSQGLDLTRTTHIQGNDIEIVEVLKTNKKEVEEQYFYDWVLTTDATTEQISNLTFKVVNKDWNVDVEENKDIYGRKILKITIKDVPVGKEFNFRIIKGTYTVLLSETFKNIEEEYIKPVPIIETKTEYIENIGLIVGVSILGLTTVLGIGYIVYDSVFYTENLIKDTIKKIKGKK